MRCRRSSRWSFPADSPKARIRAAKIPAATGVAASRINSYVHGKYRTIRPDHGAAARTPAERLELVRAYLMHLLPEDL